MASMLIRQIYQRSPLFVTVDIFLDKGFRFQLAFSNECHDVLMMSMVLIVARSLMGLAKIKP